MAQQALMIQQQIAMNYLTPSHPQIPLSRKELRDMNIPLVLSITPFPQKIQSTPSTLPFELAKIPLCRNCNCVLNYKTVIRDDQWYCPVCKNQNSLPQNFLNLMQNSAEIKQSVFDIYFPDKKLKEGEKVFRPVHSASLFLLVIERSEITVNSGLFVNTIQKIKDTFINKNEGVLSVFVFDSHLHVPSVFSKFNGKFKILSICDIESQEAAMPPAKTIFFDVKTEKKILMEYFDYLISTASSSLSQTNSVNLLKMIDLVKLLNSFCCTLKIPVSIVASRCPIGTIPEYQDLALRIIRSSTSFSFFCMNPSNETSRSNDFTPLSSFSLIVNSKCQVYSLCQATSLPNDIINAMMNSVYFDNLFYIIIPEHFSIVDIKGPGLRRSDNSLMIPAISPGDTVYVYLDYNVRSISVGTHNVQAYVRYLDARRRGFLRVINLSLYGVNTSDTIWNNLNYNVFLASTFVRCVDKAREINDIKSPLDEFSTIAKKFKENKNIYLLNQPKMIVPTIDSAFSVAPAFLQDPMNCPLIMGKSPLNITRFFVPHGYSIANMESTEMQGPFLLNNLKFYFGALYVKMHNGRALIIINENIEGYTSEMAQKWIDAIGHSPLQDAIQAVSQDEDKVIEIIFPSIASDHILYKHVMACIRTNVQY